MTIEVYTTAQMAEIATLMGNAIRDALQNVVISDQNTGQPLKIWTGTQAQYDAVTTKDNDTLYLVTE